MPYRLSFLKEYFFDFEDAVYYYETISASALLGFYSNIQNALDSLEQRPYSNRSLGYKKVRRILIKKYPYKILYRIDSQSNSVLIIGIIHTARSKNHLQNLLINRSK